MEHVTAFLNTKYFGVSAYQLSLSFAILLATLTFRRIVANVLLRFLERQAKKTETKLDDAMVVAIRPPVETGILVYGVWLAITVLPHPTEPVNVKQFIESAGHILILLIVAWLIFRLLAVIDLFLKKLADNPDHWLDGHMLPLIGNALRILVVIISGIMIAQNMGYSVSGLIASLGLGGAALALASKDTLSNLFGSLMIIIDKPFKVGDWVKGASFEGVVEEIGFRSTKIRTFGKTIENIPNNLLANVIVENMDRRKDAGLNVRRIKMIIGISYDADAGKMEEVLQEIKNILKNDEGVDQNQTILVNFTDFGESALDIFIYYFSDNAGWQYYLDVRQRVNLKIMRKLEDMNLSLAFPSRSVYIESMPEGLGKQEQKDG
ncbi:Small-conductance mechanosensitive channel [hydrothermal vent metagenome]|uniref:Small-conductance mechanosensitive channel n=1 Tax=hydrothermal vent metagenome TaxID=652676 RepID=A0A3B1D2G1_9ZZZZ